MPRDCCVGAVVARKEVGLGSCPHLCQRQDEPLLVKYPGLHRCSVNRTTVMISAVRVRQGLGLKNSALILVFAVWL